MMRSTALRRAARFDDVPVASWGAASGALAPWAALSRAGNALLTDSTGNLAYAPNNQFTQSNNFSDASWTKSNTSVSGGVADPFGGNSASTVTATAADGLLFKAVNVALGVNGINSLWIRRRTGAGPIYLRNINNQNDTIVAVSSSWQRFQAPVARAFSVTQYLVLRIGTLGDAVDIYGAQLETVTYQTSFGPYNPTTTAAYYGPRFDYDPATLSAKGLLIEASRQNVVLWNRDLSNAAWTKTNITAALNQTGVDGVANSASAITASAPNGAVLQAITLGSSQRFQTAYVKRLAGTGAVNMTTDGGATWTAINPTASWTRVSIPAQAVTNPSVGFQLVTSGDSIAVDFVQNETGAYATSPIFTTSAAVTRAAETLSITGFASNPFAAQMTSVATGVASCQKFANRAAFVAPVNDNWISSIKIWPVGTPLAAASC